MDEARAAEVSPPQNVMERKLFELAAIQARITILRHPHAKLLEFLRGPDGERGHRHVVAAIESMGQRIDKLRDAVSTLIESFHDDA